MESNNYDDINNFIKVDTEVVKSKLNSINVTTTTDAGTYGNECETTDYIKSLFTNGIANVNRIWASVDKTTGEYLDHVLIFPDPPTVGTITATSLKLREEPNGNQIESLSQGTEVDIILDENGEMTSISKGDHEWIYVRKKDGTEGYVAKEYLEITSEGETL